MSGEIVWSDVSVVGRNCSREQREDYIKWDSKSKERKKLVEQLEDGFKGGGCLSGLEVRFRSILHVKGGINHTHLIILKKNQKIVSFLAIRSSLAAMTTILQCFVANIMPNVQGAADTI